MYTTFVEESNHKHKVIVTENACDVVCPKCYEEVEPEDIGFDMDSWLRTNAPKYGTTDVEVAPDDIKNKCKIVGYVNDPATGKNKIFVHRCKNHRDCLYCAGIRAGEFFAWIKYTMEQHEANTVVEVHLDDETNYRRYRDKYGSDKVMRMPVADGTLLLIVKDAEEGEIELSLDDINNDQYLQYLSCTPERKRTSGGLKPKQIEQDEETVDVSVRVFLIDTEDQAVVKRAAHQAEQQTSDLNPNAETLQEAVNTREEAFITIARAMGLQLYTLAGNQIRKIPISKINWKT